MRRVGLGDQHATCFEHVHARMHATGSHCSKFATSRNASGRAPRVISEQSSTPISLSRKHSWRVQARRSIIVTTTAGGRKIWRQFREVKRFFSRSEKKRCSRPGFESPRGAIVCSRSERRSLAKRANYRSRSEGGGGSRSRSVRGRVKKKIVTSPRSLTPYNQGESFVSLNDITRA